jgi:secreted trypsin-like serine protease
MKRFSKVIIVVLASLVPWGGFLPAQAEPPIVGGVAADQTYSFMVSLQQKNGEHFCGGALIRSDWVVTAAHCLRGSPVGEMVARIGSIDRTRGGEVSGVVGVLAYPGYDGSRAGGDIALVHLASPVKAKPIQLGVGAQPGITSRLLGWGQTCPSEGGCGNPVVLQQLDTQIIASTSCRGIDGSDEFCVDSPGGVSGACYGDSGGPQVTEVDGRWVLLGVTSRAGGSNPTCALAPTIYTAVEPYAQWLNQNSKS